MSRAISLCMVPVETRRASIRLANRRATVLLPLLRSPVIEIILGNMSAGPRPYQHLIVYSCSDSRGAMAGYGPLLDAHNKISPLPLREEGRPPAVRADSSADTSHGCTQLTTPPGSCCNPPPT